MRREILLYFSLATCTCFLAVAQDKSKPGGDESKKPDNADSKQSGSPNDQGSPVQPSRRTFMMTGIFSDIVSYPQPDGFQAAYQNTNGDHYTLEMVLKGETVDHWTQMVSVTGVQANADNQNATARSRLDLSANVFRHACPDTFADKPLGSTTISGHEAYVAWISCGSTTRGGSAHSESNLIVSIKGTADYYTVQWAESGPASSQPLTFDRAKWGDRLQKLTPMKACPRVPGESVPYPSCLKQKPVTSIPAVTPFFGELVRFTPPEGFDIAHDDAQDTRFIREMVPEGETAELWSQMVTLTGRNGIFDAQLTPQFLLGRLAGSTKSACPDTFATKGIGPTTISGHEAYAEWVSCGSVNCCGSSLQSESALLVSVKGTSVFYTFRWAERGPASSQPIVFDEVRWGDRLKKLNSIRICAKVPGEAAPYPSCTDEK